MLIVPGYGMNSFIFTFHPRGTSLESELVTAGFEVWRVDLRCQGDSSSSLPNKEDFRLDDWAVTDLGAALEAIVERTRTGADAVDVIGASLGGSLAVAHAVLVPNNRLGALVTIGSPVRWINPSLMLRLATFSPELLGAIPLRHTRELAEIALPLLARFVPKALSIYINPKETDLSAAHAMLQTVEDPIPAINRQLAEWLQTRELVLRGQAIGAGLAGVKNPLLAVVGNADGIINPDTARFAYDASGAEQKSLLFVGDDKTRFAHADLFVANQAPALVFRPIMNWLATTCAFRQRAAS